MAAANSPNRPIRCLIIPLKTVNILVPSATMAELTGYETPTPSSRKEAWFLGLMSWRGLSIPLISMEQLLGAPAGGGEHRSSKIAVFNSLSRGDALPFFAMETLGIPRMVIVTPEMLEEQPSLETDPQQPVTARVVVEGMSAVIPDFSQLERALSP